MIKYPDSLVGTMNEKNVKYPSFIKHFICGGTDFKIYTKKILRN